MKITDRLIEQACNSLIENYDSSYYRDVYDFNAYNDRMIEGICIDGAASSKCISDVTYSECNK